MKILFLLILLNISTPIFSENKISCSAELEEILTTIQALPKANELVTRVLNEGPIHIRKNNHLPKTFSAYWDSTKRTIYLNPAPKEDLIGSILFELHNAASESDFSYYDSLAAERGMSKKQYIKTIEYIEYQNALSTSAMLADGVARGIFPKNSESTYPDTFEEHFRNQKAGGHSAWLGKLYDRLER